jgi:hypothetical protein
MLDILGLPVASVIKKNGKPSRIEPSEYGFQWYVFSRNYKKYLLAGIASGIVVAAYSNSKSLSYKGVKFNAARAAVRSALGKPLAYIRTDKLVYILNDADRRDYIDMGDRFAVVFYDMLKGGGVTAMLIVPKDAETAALTARPALPAEVAAAYGRVSADLVNASRARFGLKKLAADAKLARFATSRCADMRDRNYFDHITPDRKSPFDLARGAGIRFKSMGENIAYGNYNAILAHESFMNSKGHRDNILKKAYRKIGTGAAYGGTRYVILAQEFIR